jgi:hypothetical protein
MDHLELGQRIQPQPADRARRQHPDDTGFTHSPGDVPWKLPLALGLVGARPHQRQHRARRIEQRLDRAVLDRHAVAHRSLQAPLRVAPAEYLARQADASGHRIGHPAPRLH